MSGKVYDDHYLNHVELEIEETLLKNLNDFRRNLCTPSKIRTIRRINKAKKISMQP